MNLRKWSALLFLILFLVGCGKKEIVGTGKIVAQSRTLDQFSSIDLSGYYNVNISVGHPQSVVIKVNDNLLPYISSTVKSKTLTIQTKKGYLLRPQGIPEIDIVIPSLKEINLSGNNQATLKSYSGDELNLNFSGANQFTGEGAITQSLNIKVSGNTTIDAQKLIVNNVDIESNGSSKVVVFAKEKLNVNISGSGTITYVGNPKVSQTINGSGTISKLQETINK